MGCRCSTERSRLQRGVGDDQFRVDLQSGAQPGAFRAGTVRRVEGEGPRLKLFERQVVVGAVQVLRVDPLPPGIVLGQVHELHDDGAARQLQRGLHRVGQPLTRRGFDAEPVHHDSDVVSLVPFELRRLVQPHEHTVDPRPGEPFGLQALEQFRVLAFPPPHHGRQHLETGALRQFQHPVHDLLRGLRGDLAAAAGTVRLSDPRPQQPQVVVHLRDGADRRARVAARGLLVDGNRGRQALDEVDGGLVHLAEELAGVRGERLHVPALPLSEDRVEGQRRLP